MRELSPLLFEPPLAQTSFSKGFSNPYFEGCPGCHCTCSLQEDENEAAYELRGRAGRYPAPHLASILRSQGFLPTKHFLDRFLTKIRRQGTIYDPRSFGSEFYGAKHYLQTRPGYNTRFALIRNIPVVYRSGGHNGNHIILITLLEEGEPLPPVEPAAAPRQREFEAELEWEFADWMAKPPPRNRRRGGIPRFTSGEIKSTFSKQAGLNQLGQPSRYRNFHPNSNSAIATYDPQTGAVFLDVRDKNLTSIMDKQIGSIPQKTLQQLNSQYPLVNGKPSAAFGNAIEPLVRNLVAKATGQKFNRGKNPSANGPDLVRVKSK